MAQRWLILGAGGHGRSVADAITACGDHVVGFPDSYRAGQQRIVRVSRCGSSPLPRITTRPTGGNDS